MKTYLGWVVGFTVILGGLAGQAIGAPPPKAYTAHAESLSLFGASLKGATRAELRAAFAHSALKPMRLDDHYVADEYDASAALDGATQLVVAYTDDAAQQFANAYYTFPAGMDIQMVTKVERMVELKYGPPSYRSGDANLGPATYRWSLPAGMLIEVTRGWPNVDVNLTFMDVAANDKLAREEKAADAARNRAKAQAQNSAF